MAENFGKFSGNPATEWLSESGADRQMRLLEDFWYDDPSEHRWVAPKGAIINGASIPAPLWSIVGSPYTGEYRRASVVHDIACDNPEIPRKNADKMFYFACCAGGCSQRQAQLLYVGVRIGAWTPKIRLWSDAAIRSPAVTPEGVAFTLTGNSVQTTFREIAADIQSRPEALPFEELENLVDQHLSVKAHQ
jgi:hypothetical protein